MINTIQDNINKAYLMLKNQGHKKPMIELIKTAKIEFLGIGVRVSIIVPFVGKYVKYMYFRPSKKDLNTQVDFLENEIQKHLAA